VTDPSERTEGAAPRRRRGKLALLGLGLLLGAAVIEVGFRAAARWAVSRYRVESRPSVGETVVLCEGDSFTFGLGGESYPVQLERLLNGAAGGRRYRVVNRGIPGRTSSELLLDLPRHLADDRPDAAVIVVGWNNTYRLDTIRPDLVSSFATMPVALDRRLSLSKTYLFAKLMWVERKRRMGWVGPAAPIRGRETPAPPSPTTPVMRSPRMPPEAEALNRKGNEAHALGQWDEALDFFERAIAAGADPFESYMKIALIYNCTQRGSLAVAACRKALRLGPSPRLAPIYVQLAWAMSGMGDIPGSIRLCEQALKLYPWHEELHMQIVRGYKVLKDERSAILWCRRGLEVNPLSGPLFTEMAELYRRLGEIDRIAAYAVENPRVKDNPIYRSLQNYADVLEGSAGGRNLTALTEASALMDVEEAIRLCRRRGVALVVGSYPEYEVPGLADVAAIYGVPYVRFRPLFAERFAARRDWVAADSVHCNSRGYGYMAEVLREELSRLLEARRTTPSAAVE
jgi:tetratricopeptide (TPR) repeat protein